MFKRSLNLGAQIRCAQSRSSDLHIGLDQPLLNTFTFVENVHEHNTRNSSHKCLSLPITNTRKYGINSINYQSISAWNMFINLNFNNQIDLSTFCKYQCKNLIKTYLKNQYIYVNNFYCCKPSNL